MSPGKYIFSRAFDVYLALQKLPEEDQALRPALALAAKLKVTRQVASEYLESLKVSSLVISCPERGRYAVRVLDGVVFGANKSGRRVEILSMPRSNQEASTMPKADLSGIGAKIPATKRRRMIIAKYNKLNEDVVYFLDLYNWERKRLAPAYVLREQHTSTALRYARKAVEALIDYQVPRSMWPAYVFWCFEYAERVVPHLETVPLRLVSGDWFTEDYTLRNWQRAGYYHVAKSEFFLKHRGYIGLDWLSLTGGANTTFWNRKKSIGPTNPEAYGRAIDELLTMEGMEACLVVDRDRVQENLMDELRQRRGEGE